MPETTENQDLINAAREAVAPRELADGIYLTREGYHVTDLRKDLETGQDRPNRKTGAVSTTEADSFIGYLAKHALPETEVWANLDRATITAVINAHLGQTGDGVEDYAGWGDHRATLQLRLTDDWKDWASNDKQWLTQTGFSEFVEAHLPNFATPDGATMLELAQSFRANTSVKFESSKRLTSGQTKLEYREDIDAKAGARGDITIPETFTLALQPFEYGNGYKVGARLRYRITGGELRLGFILDRPKDVLRDAFDGVVARVEGATQRDIWHGTP